MNAAQGQLAILVRRWPDNTDQTIVTEMGFSSRSILGIGIRRQHAIVLMHFSERYARMQSSLQVDMPRTSNHSKWISSSAAILATHPGIPAQHDIAIIANTFALCPGEQTAKKHLALVRYLDTAMSRHRCTHTPVEFGRAPAVRATNGYIVRRG
jgi:hypothetical protein